MGNSEFKEVFELRENYPFGRRSEFPCSQIAVHQAVKVSVAELEMISKFVNLSHPHLMQMKAQLRKDRLEVYYEFVPSSLKMQCSSVLAFREELLSLAKYLNSQALGFNWDQARLGIVNGKIKYNLRYCDLWHLNQPLSCQVLSQNLNRLFQRSSKYAWSCVSLMSLQQEREVGFKFDKSKDQFVQIVTTTYLPKLATRTVSSKQSNHSTTSSQPKFTGPSEPSICEPTRSNRFQLSESVVPMTHSIHHRYHSPLRRATSLPLLKLNNREQINPVQPLFLKPQRLVRIRSVAPKSSSQSTKSAASTSHFGQTKADFQPRPGFFRQIQQSIWRSKRIKQLLRIKK